MAQHLQPIYNAWGGNAEAMAADIDELGVTVRQWRNRGDIPSRAWPKIIKAAAEKGVTIGLEDFLTVEVQSELGFHDANGTGDDGAASATKDSDSIGTAAIADEPANNSAENICGASVANNQTENIRIPATQEAESLHPFLQGVASTPPSSPTCSPTNAPLPPHPESQACSDGEAEAA